MNFYEQLRPLCLQELTRSMNIISTTERRNLHYFPSNALLYKAKQAGCSLVFTAIQHIHLYLPDSSLKLKTYRTIILPILLYGCETWSLTRREEHRLRASEKNV